MRIVSSTYSLDPDPVPQVRILRQKYVTELSRVRLDPAPLTQSQQELVRLFWHKYSNIEETGGTDFYHQCTGVFDPSIYSA